jgi:hypothetical protein
MSETAANKRQGESSWVRLGQCCRLANVYSRTKATTDKLPFCTKSDQKVTLPLFLQFTSYNSYNLPLTIASIEFDHFYCPKVTLTTSSVQYWITLHYEGQHPYDGTTILLDIDQSLWIHLHEIVYDVYTTNARPLVVCILSFSPLFMSSGCATLVRNAA